MSFRWEYHTEAIKAVAILGRAAKEGRLNRPATCELCGKTPKPISVKLKTGRTFERPSIVGHHWQGYGKPLEVLWICQGCNARLIGPEFHDGTMTKEQSREYILNFTPKSPRHESRSIKCKNTYTTLYGDVIKCGSWAKRGFEYCHHHQLRNNSEP